VLRPTMLTTTSTAFDVRLNSIRYCIIIFYDIIKTIIALNMHSGVTWGNHGVTWGETGRGEAGR
jgi:hypothetical protein